MASTEHSEGKQLTDSKNGVTSEPAKLPRLSLASETRAIEELAKVYTSHKIISL